MWVYLDGRGLAAGRELEESIPERGAGRVEVSLV